MNRIHVGFLLALLPAAAFSATAGSAAADDAVRPWVSSGEHALAAARSLFPAMPERAHNVILFVGDGMGIATVAAARILEGQQRGATGEENALSFEELPYLALSKTYSVNQQTSDSAPTMSAMMTGVKTNEGVISVDSSVAFGEPRRELIEQAAQATLLELAEAAGLSTGVVTTARLTHATPGACYAHTAMRDWEADADVAPGATVPDIAAQLIDRFGTGGIGNGLEVALGGGRSKFLPHDRRDPEDKDAYGERRDGRDLTREWRRKFGGKVVYDGAGFAAIDPAKTRHLLGLFERDHMEYAADRSSDSAGEPSLAEMTAKAIDILARNPKGYFLMVEAGLIDYGHHAGNAYRALTDTIALSDAVRVARGKIDPAQTLLIVTADHSHMFTFGGYARRGNPILGKVVLAGEHAPTLAADGNPYTAISYANGPGFHVGVGGDKVYEHPIRAGRVPELAGTDTTHPDFHQEALVPLEDETHAGEDVAIFAGGPAAHLFHGVQEQSYVFYVMKAALGL